MTNTSGIDITYVQMKDGKKFWDGMDYGRFLLWNRKMPGWKMEKTSFIPSHALETIMEPRHDILLSVLLVMKIMESLSLS